MQTMAEDADQPRQRIDKWLWAARFFKTRSLAAAAVDGGRIKWNGQQVKPARELKPGDELDIVAGELRWTVIVRGLNAQRRPAPEARLLYEETAESTARRLRQEEIRKLAPMPGADLKGRPTKKAGRLIRGFNE
ncbi:MAG: RNA-binding S4 domain-containing protein [Sulfuritalea sp.]|nr:RNA-binding S4 domain-containing protein [Sulfuritalea sp.]